MAAMIATPFMREVLRRPMDGHSRKDAPGAFVELSSGVTHYQWHGPTRGHIVVCIHGLTTPSPVWNGVIRGLTGIGYRVLSYDLFGRGYSDRPGGRQDGDFFVDQLEELLNALGVDGDISLFGYSMGGTIATSAAHRWPERVRHLMLLAPAGMIHAPDIWTRIATRVPILGDWLMFAAFPFLQKRAIRAEAKAGARTSVPEINEIQLQELRFRGYVPAVLSSLRAALMQWQDVEHSELGQQGVPVLAIWGEDDTVIPIAALGRLAQWNRDAGHATIPGAGHGLAYTHTDQVMNAVRDWLRDQAA